MNMVSESYPCYVQFQEEVSGIVVELPTEKDGTLLLSTVASQFPGAAGLRFKGETGAWRGVRLTVDNVFDAPLDGWGSIAYQVVMPERASKRKIKEEEEEEDESPLEKMTRMTEKEILSDLLVLSLPYETNDAEMRQYFQLFGELDFCEIKYDNNKKPRGFGFIRFKTVEAVRKCLSGTHILRGRELEVCFPKDKSKDDGTPTKLFVGRLPKDIKVEEVQEYFEKFGDLKDAYIPTPFKGFGFVSFKKQSAARTVLKTTHVIKGQYINVSHPTPKKGGDEEEGGGGGGSANGGYTWNPGYGHQRFGNQGYGNMQGMRGPMPGGGMRGMYPGGGMPRPGGPRRGGPQTSRGSMDSYYGFGFQSNKNFGGNWYNQTGKS